ncbi:hypothetical protein BGZ76_002400, partial [Entomortierella beljakovae]
MSPSNADIDNYPTLMTGISTIVKDRERSNGFKDSIHNTQSRELDLFTTPKPNQSQNSELNQRSDQDMSLEGIVSISAVSAPINNISELGTVGVSQSSLLDIENSLMNNNEHNNSTKSFHEVVASKPQLESGPDTHTNIQLAPQQGSSPNIYNNQGSDLDYHKDTEDEDQEEVDCDEGILQPGYNNHIQFSEDKYRRLKHKLKQVLEENERMSQDLDKSQRRVRNLRREKTLLLGRLCALERQDSDSGSDSLSPLSSDSDSSESSVIEEIRSKRLSPSRATVNAKSNRNGLNTTAAQNLRKIAIKPGTGQQPSTDSTSGAARTSATKETKTHTNSIPSTITNVGSATQKPKRIHQTNKQRPGLAKARKVQTIERDENGNIKFPVTVGIITILDIGRVIHDREAFHNDRYIWPVGYKMSRLYNSMINQQGLTTYTCSVIDDGDAPKFQIDAGDQPGKPIIAGTATGAWTHVVKAANAIRKRDHSNSASGPDYYGFSNATIAKMIQDLPGVEKCESYIMQRFEESLSTNSSRAGLSGTSGDKRKASSSESAAKRKDVHASGQEGQHTKKVEGDGGHDGCNDDDDTYASLGTPGKKKRASSPKIRHAGFEMAATYDEKEGSVQQQAQIEATLPSATPIHSIAAFAEDQADQPLVVVTSVLDDSEIINIEDPDSE